MFVISECCYRYRPALHVENQLIADWLIRITESQENWGLACICAKWSTDNDHLTVTVISYADTFQAIAERVVCHQSNEVSPG